LGLARLGDESIAMAAGKTWNVTVWFENLPNAKWGYKYIYNIYTTETVV
jgi:hypothetical protein